MMVVRMRVRVKSIYALGYDHGKSSSDKKAGTQHRHQMKTVLGQRERCMDVKKNNSWVYVHLNILSLNAIRSPK